MSFKISLNDISFHISINFSGLYLSLQCLLNFLSNSNIPSRVEKIFKYMVFKFLESALNLDLFYTPLPSQISFKFLSLRRAILLIPLRSHFLKICFPQQEKEVEEIMTYFVRIQSENLKMTRNIRLFILCMSCNFSNEMVLQFCK